MSTQFPAISMAAVPGRRVATLDMVRAIEANGFSGIYCPSFGDAMGLCLSIAHVTERLTIGTSIQPIYLQHASQLAGSASYIHEISEGRFRLGIGVSHGPVHGRLDVTPGKPLSDTRQYVADMEAASKGTGPLPPITLATLRDKMVKLSVEIADGAVWANASRSAMTHSLSLIPEEGRASGEFFVGNMIPTVIDDDIEACRARNRKTLKGYVALPNYRNYWKSAGYTEEMEAVEVALAAKDGDGVLAAMSDAWLDDCTLSGPIGRVREGIEAWFDAGVTTPIIVPSSVNGGQKVALEELFAAFA